MNTTSSTSTPADEADNWSGSTLDAPRQKAGDVIERASHQADIGGPEADTAAEAEATAERQAATRDGSSPAS